MRPATRKLTPQSLLARWRPGLLAMVVTAALLPATMGHAQGEASTARTPTGKVAAAGTTAPVIPAALDCSLLVQNPLGNTTVPNFEDIPGAPTRISSASIVPATADQPEYCRVQGYIAPQIKFELKLPTKTWQGRYAQYGCGGFCGTITPTPFPACRTELGGDVAVASTNDGHDASGTDALWAGFGEQPRIDFGYRSVHVLSIAAKAIQTAYYGLAPKHSYFVGCSDGGREGLMEAQYYPRDFEGIVAGAPANGMSTDPLFLAWGVRANSDAHGDPILTADKLAPLHAAVVAACDAGDGVTGDGLIGDPRGCHFDPRSVQCTSGDAPTCLTAAQVAVVRTLYRGVVDKNGTRLDPRAAVVGSELNWAAWWVPIPAAANAPAGTRPTSIARAFGEEAARYLSYPLGKGKPLDDVRLTVSEFHTLARTSNTYDVMNTDLTPFRRAGGKLLMYQGWADPLVPPTQILDWYDAARERQGGQAGIDRFTRLFMIEGMGHCGGGPTPDTSQLLLQMVRWVEDGTAPQSIMTSDVDPNGQARSRPVFRYPMVASYVGPDPVANPTAANDPANFVESAPARRFEDDTRSLVDTLLRPRPTRG